MPFDYDAVGLDREAKALLLALAEAGRLPYSQITPTLARAQYRELSRRTQGPIEGVEARDHRLPTKAGVIATRLYRPSAAGSAVLPVLVYYHGGGWVIGDLDTHDALCRQLAKASSCAVLAVDYRLAPEHRFPAAVEDACAALAFVADDGGKLGLDPRRMAVGGDSAGGNLAAVAALAARDLGIKLSLQLLYYPATDFLGDYPSRLVFAEGFLLTAEAMEWFGFNYVGPRDLEDWRASPIRAPDHRGLAPALIIIGACDPLLDEGKAYAQCLERAGVAVTCTIIPGMIHGFMNMGGVIGAAGRCVTQSAQALRQAFNA
ncbi:MAG TPA: alpha/beta hydrolase [Stellaceae bacterium]|nr:alpha/beta hydrolase [Stellaceae bacterium]